MPAPVTSIDGFDVSRETLGRLKSYEAQVRKWNPSINLVARSTLDALWDRHIRDSLQVFAAVPQPGPHWLDLGSGGGFPGAVAAIVALERSPQTRFTLIDSDQRKCVFLRTVVRELGLNAAVICARIEQAESQGADIVSARALADLATLLGYCDRHMARAGTALLQKGESWKKEEQDARLQWQFEAEILTSVTEPRAVLMKIRNLSRV